ncbi:MAG: acetyltransferase [Bacteroidota bacterium]|jgi:sugar O-acyltransferase (sialic acid O-acetyltransferase NeuD family)
MSLDNVIIFGSSGHAKVVIDIIENEGRHKIIGLLDSYRAIGETTFDYPVLGSEDDLPAISKLYPNVKLFVAVGDNWRRYEIVNKIRMLCPSMDFVSVIHPAAQIGRDVSIGVGVAIMAGVVVNCNSVIGGFSILNTNSSLDHDCFMSDFSSLAPAVTIGGNVSIGELTAISIGATVKNGLSIGKQSVIGASSLLLNNCGDNLIMYGVPAKMIRTRLCDDPYL